METIKIVKKIKPEDLEKTLSKEHGIEVFIDVDGLKRQGSLPFKVATPNGIVEYHFN